MVNNKIALVFKTTDGEIELWMKNHCGELVGFSLILELLCGFGSVFVHANFSEKL